MPSPGHCPHFFAHDYQPGGNNWPQPGGNNWPGHFPPGFQPFRDDRFNPQANNVSPFIQHGPPGFHGNQMGQYRGPIWGNNQSPPIPHNNFHQNFYNRHGFGFGQGQGQARWQHNQHQGQGTSRSHERPRTSDGDGEYKCIICKDNLQNSEERGIHLCDGGFKKENKENFIVNYEDIDARLECLLQELKGCLKKKYESVTQTLESYVSERIDEINTLHKDMTEDRSHLETMKTALEEKSAELEKLEKNLRDKENQIKEDRKKLDKETQEEKEEICRQWQQLRDEIARMEKLHEVQKGRIRLDIGGCQYTTSRLTLTQDSESMLAAMFSGRHPIKTEDDGTVFIDRDGTHFRYILNYLRDGGVQVEALPRNRQVLRELKREAIFYQLHGLVQQIEKLI